MKRLLGIAVSLLLLGSTLGWSVSTVRADDGCLTENTPGCEFGLPTAQYEALLPDMAANPTPVISTIPIDAHEVDSFTFFKILPDALIYDAPNGNVIGKVTDGFNFVSVYKQQDGFAMMRDKTWLRISSLKKTFASAFSGVLFDQPLKYPIAWVIQSSIPSAWPGGIKTKVTPAIKRYTMVNIFATVTIGDWDWYLVGPGQWLEQRKVARVDDQTLPPNAPTDTDRWVSVDLYEQVLKVYEKDKLIAATMISSGLTQWQTNVGTFTVWKQEPLTPMSGAMGAPDAYSLPAVPFVMFFDKEISLHGTYWHDGFGYEHSHGCVNMSISDAHWLYDWVGGNSLTVVVWNSHHPAS